MSSTLMPSRKPTLLPGCSLAAPGPRPPMPQVPFSVACDNYRRILRARPYHATKCPGGLMLIDMHNHTRGLSWDSDLSADQLIEEAKKAGLDGICLTEHDYFWDFETALELGRKHNFVVIPGIEI